ncbi:MAG: 16S rRNA (cytosine(1402)-N(4))-methyltransferase RsmH [Candidatus Aminicenantes bacterium]|nr:16S rRNA (cytosine(1402)-N(4))-methyltransferase RsmH [Candidatus Aminicenantes bacterium]
MRDIAHVPVLPEETLQYLGAIREGTYIDCTIGLGGHALKILQSNSKAKLVGFDLDEESLLIAKDRLKSFKDRVELYHSDFRNLPDLDITFSQVKGILLDLGISSFQLDSPERGFSYSRKGPLDMRMDLRSKTTAARIIDKYSEHKLAQIFYEFGELRQAKRLAKEIVSRRKSQEIETTSQLLQIVEDVCRWRPQKGKTHPAARVFQAIRIVVNQELEGVSDFLERITEKISAGTRMVAISFHSLEDRIVKHTFIKLASPQEKEPMLKILTKKPVVPAESEVALNFRARSAKLRAAERI